jgi:hypothetical protein
VATRRRRRKGYYVRPPESVEKRLLAYTQRENARRGERLVPTELTPNGVVLFAFVLGFELFEALEALEARGASTCPWCRREGAPKRPASVEAPAPTSDPL